MKPVYRFRFFRIILGQNLQERLYKILYFEERKSVKFITIHLFFFPFFFFFKIKKITILAFYITFWHNIYQSYCGSGDLSSHFNTWSSKKLCLLEFKLWSMLLLHIVFSLLICKHTLSYLYWEAKDGKRMKNVSSLSWLPLSEKMIFQTKNELWLYTSL